jgi:hypothetical protein
MVRTICHIADSFYLLGFCEQLCVWNEHTDEQIYQISKDWIWSIKRVMTTNTYIIKSPKKGVYALTVKDLMS